VGVVVILEEGWSWFGGFGVGWCVFVVFFGYGIGYVLVGLGGIGGFGMECHPSILTKHSKLL